MRPCYRRPDEALNRDDLDQFDLIIRRSYGRRTNRSVKTGRQTLNRSVSLIDVIADSSLSNATEPS